MHEGFLGIDVGSISTKGVVIDRDYRVIAYRYLRTQGNPIGSIRQLLKELGSEVDSRLRILGAGTTGSARRLAGVMIQADIVKNEIIAHAVAAGTYYPDVQTVLEIGGQDSKIIILRDGIPVDFAMNTVCAAGTGSFLDHQAARLQIPIEEFGARALRAKNRVSIAGRCTVFAESDMIHKAQLGVPTDDIIAGLCDAIVRNYLNTVAKGKEIRPRILFQGGVAANVGVRAAFERALGQEITVPEYFLVMGAIGAAILAAEATRGQASRFAGFEVARTEFATRVFECDGCPNRCEVVETLRGAEVIDRYGDRCGKWSEN
ncbi:MAG: acyl-CoA dehydratase activase [candidate division WOR-3 bacterium]|uniref:2-hydroxyglutaryl-CoA dehydratase n=2 Tax=candidate division WOR-3 bacterium TaxID=2052148 RepID=A0A7C1SNG3_UNCW3|nr:acyl-CoA dehydratase activase [candidate division WOR-3 bacterium]